MRSCDGRWGVGRWATGNGQRAAAGGSVPGWGPALAKVEPAVLRERDEDGGQHLQDHHAQRRARLVDRPLVEQRHADRARAPRRGRRERLAARAEEGERAAQQSRDEARALLALLGHGQKLSEPADHAELPAVPHHGSTQLASAELAQFLAGE